MARLPRLSIGGLPHLLVQRGHNGQAVFRDAEDRRRYRVFLDEACRAEQVQLHAYALLDAEVRLLLTPAAPEALSRAMQTLGRRYGGAFNRRHDRTGGLWDGRFRATVLEPDPYLLQAMRYLEEDATWVGNGAEADDPLWSSRGHHLGQQREGVLSDPPAYWALGNTPFDREAAYRAALDAGLTQAQRSQLEAAVSRGWPMGGEAFRQQLTAQTDRRLVPLKRGRPRKPGNPGAE